MTELGTPCACAPSLYLCVCACACARVNGQPISSSNEKGFCGDRSRHTLASQRHTAARSTRYSGDQHTTCLSPRKLNDKLSISGKWGPCHCSDLDFFFNVLGSSLVTEQGARPLMIAQNRRLSITMCCQNGKRLDSHHG